jgi:tetratricopeptide (TPR) repeat protein
LLRAWIAVEGGGDGAALLASSDARNSLLAAALPELRAHLLFAARKPAEAKALLPEVLGQAGGRSTRLALAFAEALRRAGDKTGAEALLAAEDPALRRFAGRAAPAGIAIDSPAASFGSLLLGLAASLAESRDGSLPLALVQVARHAMPASSEPALLLALLLERDERPADALAAIAGIAASDPFASDARDIEARTLLALKRGDEALARATAAASARDATAADFARLGGVLDELGKHVAAADAYARGGVLARSVDDPRAWTFALLRADALESAGQWSEARAELQRALVANPEEPLLLNFLGYGALVRGEDPAAAEAMIRKAVALRPGDASITDSLGWALFTRGRTEEAVETLRKAAAGDPKQAEIHEHLGDALFTAGRRIEARFAWRAALVTAEAKDIARIEAKIASGLSAATAAK